MKKKNLKILNHFANNHSVSIGGSVDITIESGYTNFKPRGEVYSMKFEDVVFLSDMIQSAKYFIWYLEREGYKVKK